MKMAYGLMWYDASGKRPVKEKILDAARRYREKFGEEPNLCLINPDEVAVDPPVTTMPHRSVRPHHFLIGVDEDGRSPRNRRTNSRNEVRTERSRR